jgi:hypothetical protein
VIIPNDVELVLRYISFFILGLLQSPGVESAQVGQYCLNIDPLTPIQPRELSSSPNMKKLM